MQEMNNKIDLTLYGRETSKTEYIKMAMLLYAESKGLNLHINEITNPDTFILDSIQSTPAIKIGSHVKCIEKEDVSSFADDINKWIMQEVDYYNNKKIIVPIDFSKASEAAVEYAKMISTYFTSYIEIVHVFHPTYIEGEPILMITELMEQENKEKLVSYVDSIIKKWSSSKLHHKIGIKYKLLLGFPADKINELSQINDPSLIIMGTTGATNLLKNLIGSVSSKVAQHAHCPVILVPLDYTAKPIKKILYCSKHIDQDIKILDKFLPLVNAFDAQLHVLHFSTLELENYNETKLSNLLNSQHTQGQVQFEYIQAKPTAKAINDYALSKNIDLIAVSTIDRGMIQQIFHASLTKKIAVEAEVPLLILHN